MTDKEQLLEKYLLKIAENLDISPTMREKAEKSYRSVGEWLGDCDVNSDVKIMPQGSFYLGTVIRPVSDEDEYDIDLVCLLKNATGKSEAEIKKIVGDRLRENKTYSSMLEPEGKRCWTLCYEEFHMDILPCVPNNRYYIEPYLTEIKLTHKLESGRYIPKYSNPYKYHEWFEERMRVRLDEVKKDYSVRNQVEISKVPLYKVKTPLQRAIQLLKRHRDIMYDTLPEARKDNAPISIIITTLAAQAYNNESTIYEALCNIVENMSKYIKRSGDTFIIANPVMPEENFADKWNENPEKAREFFRWLESAKTAILTAPINAQGLHKVSEALEVCFGRNIVRRSLIDDGHDTKIARESKTLYVDGLTGGLKTTPSQTTKKVGGHTFFGK